MILKEMPFKSCKHVEDFKNKPNSLKNLRDIQENIILLSYKENREVSKSLPLICFSCKCRRPRLHVCLSCVYIGCYGGLRHIKRHSQTMHHILALDLAYSVIHCFKCGDYVYDAQNESSFLSAYLRKGTSADSLSLFFPWIPNEEELRLLKQHRKRRRINDSTTDNLGLRGLVNLGNTCFMNCILQALAHVPVLRSYFLNDLHDCQMQDPTACLVCEMASLFQEFYSGSNKPHVPNKILHLVWSNAKHLSGYEQQDAHEFFIAALDVLHKHAKGIEEANPMSGQSFLGTRRHCKRRLKPAPTCQIQNGCRDLKPAPVYEGVLANSCSNEKGTVGGIGNERREEEMVKISASPSRSLGAEGPVVCDCIIDQIFTGRLQSDVTCKNCKSISTTIDPFWDISLDLGPNLYEHVISTSNGERVVDDDTTATSLEKCLLRFTCQENLGSQAKIKCSQCDSYQESTKQLTMKKLPIVACFHLKRFEHSLHYHKKISKFVSFPQELDMTPFLAACKDGMVGDKGMDKCSIKYLLFAVVNHIGNLDSGHYACYVNQLQNRWFRCNDHSITPVTLDDVLNSEGYLLFYQKQYLHYETEETQAEQC